MRWISRAWNYQTSSPWVWLPLYGFGLLLLGGFLI
ncbi:hypothetical protein SPMU_32230 [Sphingomonas mucosissima]|uniref:Uncharacterized protein n=1 Tax=Sphingomonas mucosissima TaxID=370959 RepID=A0A245ZE16_9SPHN|nr:hypothetical protein SPMU_32230 [Sphingomonas mucosissima]